MSLWRWFMNDLLTIYVSCVKPDCQQRVAMHNDKPRPEDGVVLQTALADYSTYCRTTRYTAVVPLTSLPVSKSTSPFGDRSAGITVMSSIPRSPAIARLVSGSITHSSRVLR